MRRYSLALLGWLGMVAAQAAAAPPAIKIEALFDGKAMVSIAYGPSVILSEGDSTEQGYVLVKADSTGATFEINGESIRYGLDDSIANIEASSTATDEGNSVHIGADRQGMYFTSGSINGFPVDFIVDTGATHVAFGTALADRLGIDYKKDGEAGFVETANGVVPAYKVSLRSVQIGGIVQHNVTGSISAGNQSREVLLGMSFLRNLDIKHGDRFLELREK